MSDNCVCVCVRDASCPCPEKCLFPQVTLEFSFHILWLSLIELGQFSESMHVDLHVCTAGQFHFPPRQCLLFQTLLYLLEVNLTTIYTVGLDENEA